MNIEEKLQEIIKSICGKNNLEFNNDADLIKDFGLDSADMIELITDVEIEFDIEIKDINSCLKYGKLLNYIKEILG